MRPVQGWDGWRVKYNSELYEVFDDPEVSTWAKLGKLRTGHVQRIPENRIPKCTLEGKIEGQKSVRKLKKRWEDSVEEACRSMLDVIGCRVRSLDKDGWRRKLWEVKATWCLRRQEEEEDKNR